MLYYIGQNACYRKTWPRILKELCQLSVNEAHMTAIRPCIPCLYGGIHKKTGVFETFHT